MYHMVSVEASAILPGAVADAGPPLQVPEVSAFPAAAPGVTPFAAAYGCGAPQAQDSTAVELTVPTPAQSQLAAAQTTRLRQLTTPRSRVLALFRKVDKSGKGRLDRRKFEKVLKQIIGQDAYFGKDASSLDIAAVLDACGVASTRSVHYEAFLQWLYPGGVTGGEGAKYRDDTARLSAARSAAQLPVVQGAGAVAVAEKRRLAASASTGTLGLSVESGTSPQLAPLRVPRSMALAAASQSPAAAEVLLPAVPAVIDASPCHASAQAVAMSPTSQVAPAPTGDAISGLRLAAIVEEDKPCPDGGAARVSATPSLGDAGREPRESDGAPPGPATECGTLAERAPERREAEDEGNKQVTAFSDPGSTQVHMTLQAKEAGTQPVETVSKPVEAESKPLDIASKPVEAAPLPKDAVSRRLVRASTANLTTLQYDSMPPSEEMVEEMEARTVNELAHRAFTLRHLLAFLRDLFAEMPKFDLETARTFDVVWDFIIPKTRQTGLSYAEMMTMGQRLLPKKMYVHSWSNLFSHLLAAVFADALGHIEYWSTLRYLRADRIDVLEAMLEDAGLLEESCWICVFCVRQHLSICASPWVSGTHGGADTLTTAASTADLGAAIAQRPPSGIAGAAAQALGFQNGPPGLGFGCANEGHVARSTSKSLTRTPSSCGRWNSRACSCGRPKITGGAACETNKTEAVLTLCQHDSQDFRVVLVADADLRLLSRLWVLAETVAAFDMKIHFQVCMHSPNVDAILRGLHFMDVRKASCSRLEDMQHLMRGVDDYDEFNFKVRLAVVRVVVSGFIGSVLQQYVRGVPASMGGGERGCRELQRSAEEVRLATSLEQVLNLYERYRSATLTTLQDSAEAFIFAQPLFHFTQLGDEYGFAQAQALMSGLDPAVSRLSFLEARRGGRDQTPRPERVHGMRTLSALASARDPRFALITAVGDSSLKPTLEAMFTELRKRGGQRRAGENESAIGILAAFMEVPDAPLAGEAANGFTWELTPNEVRCTERGERLVKEFTLPEMKEHAFKISFYPNGFSPKQGGEERPGAIFLSSKQAVIMSTRLLIHVGNPSVSSELKFSHTCISAGEHRGGYLRSDLRFSGDSVPQVVIYVVDFKLHGPPRKPQLRIHSGICDVATYSEAFRGDPSHDGPLLARFALQHVVPRFGQLSEYNRLHYRQKVPTGLLFMCFNPNETDAQLNAYAAMLEEVGADMEDVVFTYVDMADTFVCKQLSLQGYPALELVLDSSAAGNRVGRRYSRHVTDWSAATVRRFVTSAKNGTLGHDTLGLTCSELLAMPLAIEPFKEISPCSCAFWEQRYKDRRCRGIFAACFSPLRAQRDVLEHTPLFDTMAREFPELLYMWTAARRPRSPTHASSVPHVILVLDAETEDGGRAQGLRFPYTGADLQWTPSSMRGFIAGAMNGSIEPEATAPSCAELLACWLDGLFNA